MESISQTTIDTTEICKEKQAASISIILNTSIHGGQKWYMIDQSWMAAFKRYVGLDERHYDSMSPGPVNNIALLDTYTKDVKIDLIQDVDFTLVPESAWNLLISWYGIAEKQQPISRQTIRCGKFEQNWRVEIYPVPLNLCDNFNLSEPVCIKFSAADTIRKVTAAMHKIFQVSKRSNFCLWGSHFSGDFLLLPPEKAIQDIPLMANQFIVIESKEHYKEWELSLATEKLPKGNVAYTQVLPSTVKATPAKYKRPTPSNMCVTRKKAKLSTVDSAVQENIFGLSIRPGLCGLINKGNTCFMNSVIQCLSHCPLMTSYFLDELRAQNVNMITNESSHNNIAKVFGDLMYMLWSGKYTQVEPKELKLLIQQLSPDFLQNDQQDAQEFLLLFLDLLNEEFEKSAISHNSQPNNELSDDASDKQPNFSSNIIQNIFYGQSKSVVICSTCHFTSSRFDSFSVITLPLAVKKCREFQVRHIPYSQSEAVRDLLVSIPQESSILNLLLELGQYTHVPIDQMILAEFVGNHCHQFFSSEQLVSCIQETSQLILFDTPVKVNNKITKSYIILPVVLWETHALDTFEDCIDTLFGNPFIIAIHPGEISYQSLYNLIVSRTKRYVAEGITLPSTSHTSSASDAKVTLFVVCNNNYAEATELSDNGKAISFQGTDNMGYKTIAVQCTGAVRALCFKELIPAYHNTISCKPTVKLSLDDCLSAFLTSEKLEWLCPKCLICKCGTKKLELCKLPPVLIFHLKRYAYINGQIVKLEVPVDFPISNFHMENYLTEQHTPAVYNLFATVNHYKTWSGGHYTAYVKYKNNSEWYSFDDSFVSNESNIVTSASYMLFYIRKDS